MPEGAFGLRTRLIGAPEWDGESEEVPMETRREMNVRLIATGVVVIVAALVFGVRTPSGGPDWVGIITSVAGLVMIAAGLIAGFRSGASHTL